GSSPVSPPFGRRPENGGNWVIMAASSGGLSAPAFSTGSVRLLSEIIPVRAAGIRPESSSTIRGSLAQWLTRDFLATVLIVCSTPVASVSATRVFIFFLL